MGKMEEMMLYLTSYNLKEGRAGEYIAWVKKNKKNMQDHAPPGWKFRGIYASVLGFGRYDVTEIWELRKYGDFDTFRNWDDKVSLRLQTEVQDFLLPGAGVSTLLREVSDVVLVEPKKPKRSKK
jgi:hypothetical protein